MRDIMVAPGTYVVAVSGGVDSMVLLRLLTPLPDLTLIVTHYNHRVRPDSVEDAKLVESTAAKLHGLTYEYGEAPAGLGADEATLRQARYAFLRDVMQRHGADAIMTAHHQDDLLETIILQLLRGAGRRGLEPFARTKDVIRPLLHLTKEQIVAYAYDQSVEWREDSTNLDTRYKRNLIRHTLQNTQSAVWRQQLLSLFKATASINNDIDQLFESMPRPTRAQFISWPFNVSREYLAHWLRAEGVDSFDKILIERVAIGLKTLPAGRRLDLKDGLYITVSLSSLALSPVERYNKETYG